MREIRTHVWTGVLLSVGRFPRPAPSRIYNSCECLAGSPIRTKCSAWDRNATQVDVRRAYLRLAKRHHPDKNPSDKASEWIFKEVQSAYETLRDAKAVRPNGQQGPPPSQTDRAERDQHDGTEHDRRREQRSEWSHTDYTVLRTLRWAKWPIYCSNVFLGPAVAAGLLDSLSVGGLFLVMTVLLLGSLTFVYEMDYRDAHGVPIHPGFFILWFFYFLWLLDEIYQLYLFTG